MTTLRLGVPGPDASAQGSIAGAPAGDAPSGLDRLLARGRFRRDEEPIENRLCAAFGVAGAPVAALTRPVDLPDVPDGDWLRADPVYLHADLARLLLFDAGTLGLERAEAIALIEILNAHLAADGLRIEMGADPGRWYLRVPRPVSTRAPAPERLRGEPVAAPLAREPEDRLWRRRSTELQMLLHEHPVNLARAARGAHPVNAVWFWGGGRILGAEACKVTAAFGATALLRGLGAHKGVPVRPCPHDASTLLDQLRRDDEAVAVLDEEGGLPAARSAQRSPAWRDDFDARWWRPLLRALQWGRLTRLECWLDAGTLVIDSHAARRFWQARRSQASWPAAGATPRE